MSKQLKFTDLLQITVHENHEKLVPVTKILSGYHEKKRDLEKFLNGKILVRESVAQRLYQAQSLLENEAPHYKIHIFEGYRPLSIQTDRFLKRLATIATEKYFENPTDLYEKVHETVAVPTVAGHPTGGAVDVVIKDTTNGEIVDFGSEIYDYTTDQHNFLNQNVTPEGQKNRNLLRNCMLTAGFAPFDGEYWHFSYGDTEWAAYYNQPHALYKQLDNPTLS